MEYETNKSTPVFDKRELLERLCDDEELMTEVVDVFLQDTPDQIETLKAAIASGDIDAVGKQGHTIKGSSSNVAAMRMRDLAFEIEKAGKSQSMDALPILLKRLEEAFREFRQKTTN